MVRRRSTVLVSAALLAAALSACSSGGDDADEPSGQAPSSALTTQLPAPSDEIDALNWALPAGEPSTLDPRNAGTQSNQLVVSNLCDSVLTTDASYHVQPNLMSAEQVDPKTVELTLVADAKFWNGNPVTTEDVAYSLNRAMDPAAVLSYFYANVVSIKATDAKTVTIKFKAPDELFLKEISGPAGSVMEKTFSEKAGKTLGTAKGGLMCSGPFELASWKAGSSITLTKNDDYWNADRAAHARTVNLEFITDATALSQALTTGAVDGAYEVPTSAIPSLQKSSDGKVYFGTGPLSYFMGWAHPGAPLDDVKLRKALYISTDRTALADKVFNGAGGAAYTLVWPGTFDPETIDEWEAGVKPFEQTNAYDLEEAKKLVEESSYQGQKLVMTIQSGDETMSTVAQYIQQQADQIGVRISINPVQAVDYNTQTYDTSARKGTDILIGPSYNGFPDPAEGLGFIFEPGGAYNWTGYDDPKVLDLVTEARATFDAQKRTEMLLQAQEIYEQEYPEVTLLSVYEVSYLSDKLTGMVTTTAYARVPSLALIGAK